MLPASFNLRGRVVELVIQQPIFLIVINNTDPPVALFSICLPINSHPAIFVNTDAPLLQFAILRNNSAGNGIAKILVFTGTGCVQQCLIINCDTCCITTLVGTLTCPVFFARGKPNRNYNHQGRD